MSKEDDVLANGRGESIRLRDSIPGDTVLVMLETSTAKVWVLVNKKELKAFINNYLVEID